MINIMNVSTVRVCIFFHNIKHRMKVVLTTICSTCDETVFTHRPTLVTFSKGNVLNPTDTQAIVRLFFKQTNKNARLSPCRRTSRSWDIPPHKKKNYSLLLQ